ncbi:16S rRNA (cytosine(1402)-N(4))-methyltransferase RsmH [Floccifex sp.]|uniref:16S rRNA (cytosine(1402)-N(4))-methyltransferase RsmH n=1 Tax=Floccifex sp. TaxID=2815810 RepID=UPI003EFDC649
MKHISVLLHETIDMLNIKDDGLYVDCTLGRGGHSSEILKQCTKGHLYAIDCDAQAIQESSERLKQVGTNFTCIHDSFQNLGSILDSMGVEAVDGILLDLGVSSPQFDDEKRGFSYRMDARLDMRMNQEQQLDAWMVINSYSKEELSHIFKEYGEEPFAYKIACQIEKVRKEKPIDSTLQLVDVIKQALPEKVLRKKGHPAKKVFQAIRIEVNHELDQLSIVLKEGLKRLKPNGRLVVITFHSLEDRIVKQIFKEVAVPKKVDKRLPELRIEKLDYQLINRKPVVATNEELIDNNRAHSAKLRGIERIGSECEKM